MCWRDNVVQTRWCSFCGQSYYGDLGHRNCPKGWLKKKPLPEQGLDDSALKMASDPQPHERK